MSNDVEKVEQKPSPTVVPKSAQTVISKDYDEQKVDTKFGQISVLIRGDRSQKAIVTFHDLGLNALACFGNFFASGDVSSLTGRFSIYHVNAPGQEDDAKSFPENFIYPTMDELADVLATVIDHFKIRDFIGFGVGAGANVLCRYALKFPDKVNALILINCSASTSGWLEWGYQKANIFYLRKWSAITPMTVDYLMWHHFGRNVEQYYDKATVAGYRDYFSSLPSPKNLSGYIGAYVNRTILPIKRQGPTLKCPVLQIVSAHSPHLNETLGLNTRLDPSKSDWLKISDCGGFVLEDVPDKVAEATLLFLQGQGHVPAVSHAKWVARRPSATTGRSMSVCVPTLMRRVGRDDASTLGGAKSPGAAGPKASDSDGDPSSTPSSPSPKQGLTAAASAGGNKQLRSHSIATPGRQAAPGDEHVFNLFDRYQTSQIKKDHLKWTQLETTQEEEVFASSSKEGSAEAEPKKV